MSFEQLLKTLEEKCKAEETAILSAAKNEAKKTNAAASEKAKQVMDDAKHEGQKLGGEQRAEISANARLRERKTLAEAREVLLNKAIQGVEPLLQEFAESKEYEKTLLHLAKDCINALGKDAVLRCKREDEKALKLHGFNIGSPVKIIGGVIGEAQEGKIKVDNSFETLLSNHSEKLKQIAYKALNPALSNIKPKYSNVNAKPEVKQIKPQVATKTVEKVQTIQKPPTRKTNSKPLQKGKNKR
ncbi:MAG: V-type ATP synthase subunit E family protein [Candidatus Micrarchaeota archaeon]|nr:V-type ATP synthase subunit E family protein [Candidatus Micrarchaeota archaeon]